ncbi:hypothetical protein ACQPZJ_43160 [Actinoplanes sp. CA-054009]
MKMLAPYLNPGKPGMGVDPVVRSDDRHCAVNRVENPDGVRLIGTLGNLGRVHPLQSASAGWRPRSTILRAGPVHMSLAVDPAEELERLENLLVR